MRSAHSPLLRSIREVLSRLMADELPHADEPKYPYALTRRGFLAASTVLGSSLLAGRAGAAFSGRQHPKVVIVGAGLAGLSAGLTLQRSKIHARIYEASNRVGGRVSTVGGAVVAGTFTEFGGEFIDSGHEDIHRLCKELRLTLLDRRAVPDAGLIRRAYFSERRLHPESDLVDELRPMLARLVEDASVLASNPTFENPGKAETLDYVMLSDYLDSLQLSPWLTKLLDAAFVTENGLGLHHQSALNFLSLLPSVSADGRLQLFGDSDERYKVAGGNARLPDAIARELGGQIEYSMKLRSVLKKGSGYTLEFETPADGKRTVEADIVLLAIPFSVLRDVGLDIDLPQWKRRAITELQYGTNTKVMMGFTARPWRDQGYVGEVLSDENMQLAWDNTELDQTDAGGLTVFLGGDTGVEATKGTVSDAVRSYLTSLERVFPGVGKVASGRNARMDWVSNTYSRGSYSTYGPGHWTTIRGAEIKPVDNLYFAGEHCSLEFQGFMNGAAETGRRAAENIIASLK